jgi:hypothetical protein
LLISSDGSHISRGKKSKFDCRKWSFKDMLHPKARYDFYVAFLLSLSPKSYCIRFQTRPSLYCQQHSIYFWSRGLEKKLFSLRTDENDFFNLSLTYAWKYFSLNRRILRLLYSSPTKIF